MKIDLAAIRPVLEDMLLQNMEGTMTGGQIAVDREGKLVSSSGSRRSGWSYVFLEVVCDEETFDLLLNPQLRFKQTIDLMGADIPDTVAETLDYLWETITAAAEEYETCFQ